MEAEEKVLTAQYTSDISYGASFSKKYKSKRTIDSIKLNAEAGMIFLCFNVFILFNHYGFKNNMLNMNQFVCKI